MSALSDAYAVWSERTRSQPHRPDVRFLAPESAAMVDAARDAGALRGMTGSAVMDAIAASRRSGASPRDAVRSVES